MLKPRIAIEPLSRYRIRFYQQQRLGPRGYRSWRICILLCLFLNICTAIETCSPPSSPENYQWENLNYYEILDLAPTDSTSRRQRQKERSKITSSDVRKAYRKQAQKYHPDKVKSNANATWTVEESNSRFARIAEAFQVLSDKEKRLEYDAFLLDCEDQLAAAARAQQTEGTTGGGASSSNGGNSRWSLFDDLSTDPRRVFEEFFFGSSEAEPSWDDFYNPGGGTDRRGQGPTSSSVRVSEKREIRYDPRRGTDVLRVLQTEHHPPNPDGRSFYRVTAQEFVEQYDRYQGGWSYVPIGPAVVVEEGYTDIDKQEQQRRQSGPRDTELNMLWPGEFLTPESTTLLTSANGRYYAGLSSECELLIMADASRLGHGAEDTVIWSSQTYVPPSHMFRAGGCFLGLQGPHLIVALGSPDRPGTVLWYSSDVSDAAEEEEERVRLAGGPPPLYFARLDDDGSLAVYFRSTVEANDETPTAAIATWWAKIFKPASVRPRTRAARAWVRVREWTHRNILDRATWRSSSTSSSGFREICLYATGPAGCNRPGRKILHLANDAGQSVRHTMSKIDNAIDNFVESLSEDEDEDLLDTLLRVLSKAGSGVGRAGQRIAKKGAKAFRDVLRERFHPAR